MGIFRRNIAFFIMISKSSLKKKFAGVGQTHTSLLYEKKVYLRERERDVEDEISEYFHPSHVESLHSQRARYVVVFSPLPSL